MFGMEFLLDDCLDRVRRCLRRISAKFELLVVLGKNVVSSVHFVAVL